MDNTIGQLLGHTLVAVTRGETHQQYSEGGDSIIFQSTSGERWEMFHSRDCCEDVHIEDIVGDLQDLVGSPISMAEESTSETRERGEDGVTWTFYKLATAKGYVTIRWYGSSNGYYSESVDVVKMGSNG